MGNLIKESKKELLNQFFERAKSNNLEIILDNFNLQTGEQTYTVLSDIESIKLKQEYIEKNYTEDLEYIKCKCMKIEDFYIIEIKCKGSEFIC